MKQVRYKLRCNFCSCVQIFPPTNQSAQKAKWIDTHLDSTKLHCVGNTELLCPPHHYRPDPEPHPRGTPHLSVNVPERLLIRVWTNDFGLADIGLLGKLVFDIGELFQIIVCMLCNLIHSVSVFLELIDLGFRFYL